MVDSFINKNKISNLMENNRIFAVVRTDSAEKTIAISNALIAGGIKVLEITMEHDDSVEAIRELAKNKDIYITAGSVITADQAEKAINAGAKLIISPILEMRLIKLCRGRRVPIIIGAATPTEAYEAWKFGVNVVKIFPVKALGGADYVRDILTPMPFLKLVPTGGVDFDNFIDYLEAGAVAVGMGNAFYADETDYSNITKKAKDVVDKLNNYLAKNK